MAEGTEKDALRLLRRRDPRIRPLALDQFRVGLSGWRA